MRMYDIIEKKRDGYKLSKEEIEFFVNGFTNGTIPDYQASAFLMAVFFNQMDKEETIDLTMAMLESGDKLDLSKIEGIKVDKHSTGGVGDKTTIILAPLVAAAGVPVAKMSGRGLGHTGGTIDKFESFDDFKLNIPEEKFIADVNEIGVAIASQTGDLAPADKKIYALRDVTATVNNLSLIASSIMSKKLASGADAIVLDVKTGSGAFMKEEDDAFDLAKIMVEIGCGVGRNTIGVITDMDEPLGFAVGNVLEVIEAIDTLKGEGPKDLTDLCLELGAHMLVLGGKASDIEDAKRTLEDLIDSGKALEKLKELIAAQGGNPEFIENYEMFKKASIVKDIYLEDEGFIQKIESEEVGKAALVLGAGRETKESEIDLAVGIVLSKKVGDYVGQAERVATIYANDLDKFEEAKEILTKAYIVENKEVEEKKLIKGIVYENNIVKY
ncbi:MAG: pyrimidine-nucleoside phosphorylase [Clostridia bacterium]|nr:pyrimidine-nucleoside phosphorylase [Clostridia bacterium]